MDRAADSRVGGSAAAKTIADPPRSPAIASRPDAKCESATDLGVDYVKPSEVTGDARLQLLGADQGLPDQAAVEHERATLRDSADAVLGVRWRTDLAHDKDVERRPERPRHLVRDGYAWRPPNCFETKDRFEFRS